jgi:hypothetical protein
MVTPTYVQGNAGIFIPKKFESGTCGTGTLQENPDQDTDLILEMKIFENIWNFQRDILIFLGL